MKKKSILQIGLTLKKLRSEISLRDLQIGFTFAHVLLLYKLTWTRNVYVFTVIPAGD